MSKNEVVDLNKLVELAQENTIGIQGMRGVLALHESRIAQVEATQNAQEHRITTFEQNERIDRISQRRMHNAVHARCYFLLDIKREGGHVVQESMGVYKEYFKAFASKCYTDAKNRSRMGDPYSETKKRDYTEVMQYIEGWEPEISYDGLTGTKAYMKYLNELRTS